MKLKRIQGVVEIEKKGPVSGAVIVLSRSLPTGLEEIAQTTTDSAGRFRFGEVSRGKYFVAILVAGYAQMPVLINVSWMPASTTGLRATFTEEDKHCGGGKLKKLTLSEPSLNLE